MEEFFKRSITTGRTYDIFSKDILHIINSKQASFYVSKGCDLLAVKLSEDRKTGEPIFVYLFFKSESYEAYDEWCKRKENNEGN